MFIVSFEKKKSLTYCFKSTTVKGKKKKKTIKTLHNSKKKKDCTWARLLIGAPDVVGKAQTTKIETI